MWSSGDLVIDWPIERSVTRQPTDQMTRSCRQSHLQTLLEMGYELVGDRPVDQAVVVAE
jgi:hypothetical protein